MKLGSCIICGNLGILYSCQACGAMVCNKCMQEGICKKCMQGRKAGSKK